MSRTPACPKHLTPITLGEAARIYEKTGKGSQQAKATLNSRMVIVRLMVWRLGADRCVWTLGSKDFRKVYDTVVNEPTLQEVAWREQNGMRMRPGRVTANARNQTKVFLRHFGRWLIEEDYMVDHVDLAMKSLWEPGKESVIEGADHRIFRPDEWPTLLQLAESIHPRVRMAVAFGLYCGRRISEVVRVQWGDIKLLDEDIVFWDVKNGKHVKTPLYPDIEAELKYYRRWVTENYGIPRPEWYIVASRKFGEEITGVNSRMGIYADPATWPLMMERISSKETVNMDVRKMLDKYGIGANEGTGTHSWRRSAACYIADEYGLDAAQAFCGHKTVVTTQLYTKNREGYNKLKDNLMKRPARDINSLMPNVIPMHHDNSGWEATA